MSYFARIPNLSFLLDIVLNGEKRLSISFFIFEIFGCKLWDLFKKSSIFGTRQRKYSNTGGGGGHARGQKSFEFHRYYLLVFITIYFHSAFTFMPFQSYNRIKNSQFYCFPGRHNFRYFSKNF